LGNLLSIFLAVIGLIMLTTRSGAICGEAPQKTGSISPPLLPPQAARVLKTINNP